MLEVQRFKLILCVSSVLHAIIIFTVSWSFEDPAPPSQTLDITLAQYQTDIEPEAADFLAQANQQGSGTLEEKAELSTIEQAQFRANEIREVQKLESAQQMRREAASGAELLVSVQKSWAQKNLESTEQSELQNSIQEEHFQQRVSSEIASLEAELRNERQAFARRPRRRQLTAVATKASVDAAYLSSWRQKIESVGNMNFPDLQLYGELTLLVAVRANGTIEKLEVRRSSGFRSLDDAAKRIVRLAAPFDPFPEEIRKHTDILEIIRTWRFEKGGYLSGSS